MQKTGQLWLEPILPNFDLWLTFGCLKEREIKEKGKESKAQRLPPPIACPEHLRLTQYTTRENLLF
jgi:hypothetical protein